MAAAVPKTVPSQFAAGDSVTWQITNSDYPAPTYSLVYYLHGRAQDGSLHRIGPLASTANGSDHLMALSSADTAAFKAGSYSFKCFAMKTGERWEIDNGIIEILPDFAGDVATDTRSLARKQLDNIEDVITKLVSRQLMQYTTSSGSFTLTNIGELYKIRDRLKQQVMSETGGGSRQIRARFTNEQAAISPGALWP